jgi:hypothetical protein
MNRAAEACRRAIVMIVKSGMSCDLSILGGALALALWGMAVGGGMFLMLRFSNAPGPIAVTPGSWPAESSLPHRAGRSTLVLFAHPRCPCTAASLEQLKSILAAAQASVDCNLVFLTPPSEDADWRSSRNVRMAEGISSVAIAWDSAGAEARRFAATTSGTVVLYDAAGLLRFSGGITVARGHAGDNVGADAVVRVLTGGRAERLRTPVFGCPLFEDENSCRENAPCSQ